MVEAAHSARKARPAATLFPRMADAIRDLTTRASAGDARAVEQLLVRYLPDVEAYVARHAGALLGARESGADLAQSVCREALERLRGGRFRFEGEAQFRQWLYRAAVLKLMGRARYWRAERRDRAHESAAGSADGALAQPADSETPSRAAEVAEELATLERAFAALTDDERELITLSHVEGLTHAEIATRRGTSEAYSRTLLSRALARLAKLGAS